MVPGNSLLSEVLPFFEAMVPTLSEYCSDDTKRSPCAIANIAGHSFACAAVAVDCQALCDSLRSFNDSMNMLLPFLEKIASTLNGKPEEMLNVNTVRSTIARLLDAIPRLQEILDKWQQSPLAWCRITADRMDSQYHVTKDVFGKLRSFRTTAQNMYGNAKRSDTAREMTRELTQAVCDARIDECLTYVQSRMLELNNHIDQVRSKHFGPEQQSTFGSVRLLDEKITGLFADVLGQSNMW